MMLLLHTQIMHEAASKVKLQLEDVYTNKRLMMMKNSVLGLYN